MVYMIGCSGVDNMAADPLDCNRQVYQANVFRKLDLVLHRDDGLEYDENGCMPCIPGCKKPVYEAGQLITGYLLVRPTRKMIITGMLQHHSLCISRVDRQMLAIVLIWLIWRVGQNRQIKTTPSFSFSL
jgi:hypothetical protein